VQRCPYEEFNIAVGLLLSLLLVLILF